jgi:energy-coupling factor transporter ATP-binding protein EcfA2
MSDDSGETREMDARTTGVTAPPEPGATTSTPVPRTLTLDDIEHPPVEEFVWGKTIPFGKATVIYGPSGAGKSALIAQVVFAVAAGDEELLGRKLWPGSVSVLVYTAEDTFDDWKRKGAALLACGVMCPERIQKAIERIQIMDASEGIARLVESVTVWVDGPSERITRRTSRPTEEADAIIAAARATGRSRGLIVIETVSRIIDDEDNPAMSALMSVGGAIARATGWAVLFSHHPGKAASKENDSSPEAARGGSALISNSRNSLSLYPADPSVAGKYKDHFAADDIFALEHRKPTSSTRPEPQLALVAIGSPWGRVFQRPEEVAFTPEQEQVNAARVSAERQREGEALCRLYEVVERMLPLGEVSPTRLRDRLSEIDVKKRGLERLVETAIERGILLSGPPASGGRGVRLALGRDPRKSVPVAP